MKIKNIFKPIAKPFKFIDKEVLRWYTKKAKKLEEKGYDVKKINLGLSGVYLLTQISSGTILKSPLFEIYSFYGLLPGCDLARNFYNSFIHPENSHTSSREKIIEEPIIEKYKKITNLSRLPALAWGLVNTGKGIYDVGRYVATGESPNWSETAFNLSTGIEHLALASSIYFKARDPKLLDKAPAWKNAYEKSKEKVKEIKEGIKGALPEPVPELIPIKSNYSLEGRLN